MGHDGAFVTSLGKGYFPLGKWISLAEIDMAPIVAIVIKINSFFFIIVMFVKFFTPTLLC